MHYFHARINHIRRFAKQISYALWIFIRPAYGCNVSRLKSPVDEASERYNVRLKMNRSRTTCSVNTLCKSASLRKKIRDLNMDIRMGSAAPREWCTKWRDGFPHSSNWWIIQYPSENFSPWLIRALNEVELLSLVFLEGKKRLESILHAVRIAEVLYRVFPAKIYEGNFA